MTYFNRYHYRKIIQDIYCITAKLLCDYIENAGNINEGTAAKHCFNTIENFLTFPLANVFVEDDSQVIYFTAKRFSSGFQDKNNFFLIIFMIKQFLKPALALLRSLPSFIKRLFQTFCASNCNFKWIENPFD